MALKKANDVAEIVCTSLFLAFADCSGCLGLSTAVVPQFSGLRGPGGQR
jgi:hypothetical protein